MHEKCFSKQNLFLLVYRLIPSGVATADASTLGVGAQDLKTGMSFLTSCGGTGHSNCLALAHLILRSGTLTCSRAVLPTPISLAQGERVTACISKKYITERGLNSSLPEDRLRLLSTHLMGGCSG